MQQMDFHALQAAADKRRSLYDLSDTLPIQADELRGLLL